MQTGLSVRYMHKEDAPLREAGQRSSAVHPLAQKRCMGKLLEILGGEPDAEVLLADRSYDTNDILAYTVSAEMKPVIPPKKNRKEQHGCDQYLYKLCYLAKNKQKPRKSTDFLGSWSKRSKSIFLSETNHDSLQVSNWGTDEKQVNTFLFKNHLQNRYIGEFLNSLNCFSDKEPKSFCASSCSSSRRKAHISRKLSDVLDIIACNSDFS